MAIIWHEKNPGATEDEIRAFEEKERITLPESYKTFLREMDGGRPQRHHDVHFIDARSRGSWASVKDFYGIRETAFSEEPYYLDWDLPPDATEDMLALREEKRLQYEEANARLENFRSMSLSLSIVRQNMKSSDDEDFQYFPDNMLFVADTGTGHTAIVLLLGTEEVYLWGDDGDDPVFLAPTFTDFLGLVRFDVSNEEYRGWNSL